MTLQRKMSCRRLVRLPFCVAARKRGLTSDTFLFTSPSKHGQRSSSVSETVGRRITSAGYNHDVSRLRDVEVLPSPFSLFFHPTTAQLTSRPVFLFSTVTSWGLLSLSRDLKMQQHLREELREFTSDSPSTEELDALPYLDAFVKETLRVYPVVPTIMREVTNDCHILPLSESITGKDGAPIDSIPLPTGTVIHFRLSPSPFPVISKSHQRLTSIRSPSTPISSNYVHQ